MFVSRDATVTAPAYPARVGDFTRLRAWQLADELAAECRNAARDLPAFERDDLADQLRRAATSIPLNIAEGESKPTLRGRLASLRIARTSVDEVRAILSQVRRARYLHLERQVGLERLRDETGRTLFGLIRMLERRLGES